MNLNKVQLIGRITKTPERKTLPSGITVANFSVATNHVYKDQQGQKVENVDFHNLVAFNKTADIITKYLDKGSLVYVEGRLQTRSWEDTKTGDKKYRTEIMVDNVQLPPKSINGGSSDEGRDDTGYQQSEKPIEPRGMDVIDYGEVINPDDIPF